MSDCFHLNLDLFHPLHPLHPLCLSTPGIWLGPLIPGNPSERRANGFCPSGSSQRPWVRCTDQMLLIYGPTPTLYCPCAAGEWLLAPWCKCCCWWRVSFIFIVADKLFRVLSRVHHFPICILYFPMGHTYIDHLHEKLNPRIHESVHRVEFTEEWLYKYQECTIGNLSDLTAIISALGFWFHCG